MDSDSAAKFHFCLWNSPSAKARIGARIDLPRTAKSEGSDIQITSASARDYDSFRPFEPILWKIVSEKRLPGKRRIDGIGSKLAPAALLLLLLKQLVDLGHELLHILKLHIYRRESKICNLVQSLQLGEENPADLRGG